MLMMSALEQETFTNKRKRSLEEDFGAMRLQKKILINLELPKIRLVSPLPFRLNPEASQLMLYKPLPKPETDLLEESEETFVNDNQDGIPMDLD